MRHIQALIISAAVPVGAVVLAACGGAAATTAAAPAAAPSGGSATAAAPPASSASIKTASVGQLGTVVVNSQGMTLYRFDADSNNPPASHCDSSCTKYWPPVLAGSGTPAVQGVSASLLGTVTRSDGTKQITLGGWPLYMYVGDHAAGDANGQGLDASGAKWWALTATGQKAGSAASSSSSSSGGYGNGY
ncbi:MAG TPA: hypothetical protein VFU65_08705 [Actinocrinis sp.]|nr:hypothetical protein [Actinocrinis sp.]